MLLNMEKPNLTLHDAIISNAALKIYQKDSSLIKKGEALEYVYLIIKGRVKTISTFQGAKRRLMYHIIYPGEFVGIGDIFSGSSSNRMTAMALDKDVAAWQIPFFDFELELRKNPDLANIIISQIIKKSENLWKRFFRKNNLPLKSNVLAALLDMAREKGVPEKEGFVIQGVSHNELAEYLGICRQSATQTLNTLKREKIIEYTRNKIFINPKISSQ